MTETPEKLPISEFLKLIDHITIFKSKKWWEAVVVSEAYGKRSIGLYLWEKRQNPETKQDVWKRKHKFSVRNMDEWKKLEAAIEQLAPKLASS